MCRCDECRFGYKVIFDSEPDKVYYWCNVIDNVMDEENALNNELGCDLYVEKLDDNKTS